MIMTSELELLCPNDVTTRAMVHVAFAEGDGLRRVHRCFRGSMYSSFQCAERDPLDVRRRLTKLYQQRGFQTLPQAKNSSSE